MTSRKSERFLKVHELRAESGSLNWIRKASNLPPSSFFITLSKTLMASRWISKNPVIISGMQESYTVRTKIQLYSTLASNELNLSRSKKMARYIRPLAKVISVTNRLRLISPNNHRLRRQWLQDRGPSSNNNRSIFSQKSPLRTLRATVAIGRVRCRPASAKALEASPLPSIPQASAFIRSTHWPNK